MIPSRMFTALSGIKKQYRRRKKMHKEHKKTRKLPNTVNASLFIPAPLYLLVCSLIIPNAL